MKTYTYTYMAENTYIRREDGLKSDDPLLGIKRRPDLWPPQTGTLEFKAYGSQILKLSDFTLDELRQLARGIQNAWNAIGDDICDAIGGPDCDNVSMSVQIECTLDADRVKTFGVPGWMPNGDFSVVKEWDNLYDKFTNLSYSQQRKLAKAALYGRTDILLKDVESIQQKREARQRKREALISARANHS